ncbi:hypothetical protein D3C86_1566840 [compost metagenome]
MDAQDPGAIRHPRDRDRNGTHRSLLEAPRRVAESTRVRVTIRLAGAYQTGQGDAGWITSQDRCQGCSGDRRPHAPREEPTDQHTRGLVPGATLPRRSPAPPDDRANRPAQPFESVAGPAFPRTTGALQGSRRGDDPDPTQGCTNPDGGPEARCRRTDGSAGQGEPRKARKATRGSDHCRCPNQHRVPVRGGRPTIRIATATASNRRGTRPTGPSRRADGSGDRRDRLRLEAAQHSRDRASDGGRLPR